MGERVTHALMGIVYGALLVHILPEFFIWANRPTGFENAAYGVLGWALVAMAIGAALSGFRDLWAGRSVVRARFPSRDHQELEVSR